MNYNIINLLKTEIRKNLLNLIDNDYILLDLPYHSNLGDTLIWQGELDFLKQLHPKCKYQTWHQGSIKEISKHINKDTILLFHGGGNFGDLWPAHNAFRKKIHKMFPDQKSIIFPQTIYYNSQKELEEDAEFYSNYPNITICARDIMSFNTLKKYFLKSPSLLVPDMAFYMDMNRYKRNNHPHGSIFVRREDKEKNDKFSYQEIPQDAEISDWQFLNKSKEYRLSKMKWISRFDCYAGTNLSQKWFDWYWQHVLRPLNVKTAIKFIDRYELIYTSRMHAAILGILLGKTHITLFDNNYGKSSSLYYTWLKDVDELRLIQ